MILSFILILGCSATIFAADSNNNYTKNLPHNGAEYFEIEVRDDEENEKRISDFITVYGYQYTKGNLKSGTWRNGTSGGSSASSSTLSLNYTNNNSYNISFTASVSGNYTNGGTIGSNLGVTLGASKSYSLGSGYSVTVPKGSHYLIKYRPMYYTYEVVEIKYMIGMYGSMASRGICTCKRTSGSSKPISSPKLSSNQQMIQNLQFSEE